MALPSSSMHWTNQDAGRLGLPIRMVWISSVFSIMGGGDTVIGAVLGMVLTDATPATLRSRVFLYFSASNLLSEVISPPIASYLMTKDLWAPLMIGLLCNLVTILIAASTQETLPPTGSKSSVRIMSSHNSHVSSSPDDNDHTQATTNTETEAVRVFKAFRYTWCQHTLRTLVFTFLVSEFARQSLQILLQYVSIRYSVSLAKVC